MMRQAVQRLGSALTVGRSTLPPARRLSGSAFEGQTIGGDTYLPLGERARIELTDPANLRALRVNAMVTNDATRKAFTEGLDSIFKAAPRVQTLQLDPFYWRKAPAFRRRDNYEYFLPHAPKWQWDYPYEKTPEVPESLGSLAELRTVTLGEEVAAAVAYLPPGVESLTINLGPLSQLPAKLPPRLSSVRNLRITTTCERLPEVTRLLQAAPRTECLELVVQNHYENLVQQPFELPWPAALRSLKFGLVEVPFARWHGPEGGTAESFFGAMWQSMPKVQELTLDLHGASYPLHKITADLHGWRGRYDIKKLAFNGTQATYDDVKAVMSVLPRRTTLTFNPPAALESITANPL